MDAEDGLDLDPYSPVSNSNTEEMEELLRVEEEILNSPPKAEPASKADKGDKVRLSGAARKRLAHYLAKGVPLEQARVLAKQPMPTAERGKKAGGSLKRERSANTTPEMSLPKRGSAKPGAGVTPARVPEIEAGSTNRKTAQPPIPKPTEATGTREHRSYSEVASSDRFAVIAKGYPTALLSTKELVMVREAILDKIREQRQGAVKPYFTGCSLRPGWLLISCANQETANWLKATVPKLKLWNGAQIEIVAEADMPRPQIYVGYFPKTEKCSNEDILQLLEGQNSALRIGDWRTLNRVERGKHVELTLSVDPVSDDQMKSQGYTLCYGFGLVNVRPKNRHSVGVKDTAAEPEPGTASTTQMQEASQELPCCSNRIAPSSNTPEVEKEKAGGSTLEGLMTSAKAAKMERPATNAPQVARMRPPLYGRLPNKPGKGARRSQEETVLLGSNRASDVLCCRFAKEDLDIAFLQEPWILSGKIKGLNTREGNLIYAYEQQRLRAALLLNKKMTFVPLSQFITEDLVAVWAKVPTASGEQEAVLASAYFPGDSSDAPPREVSALVEYCQDKRIRWIIGCDVNAHHTVWGSTDVNKRGECLLEFLVSKNISVLNRGDEPTFRNAIRGEVLDLTICSSNMLAFVSNWHVSGEVSMSDHQHIRFDIGITTLTCPIFKNPRTTNWEHFTVELEQHVNHSNSPIHSMEELEYETNEVHRNIENAFKESCIHKHRNSQRDVPWWNKLLEKLPSLLLGYIPSKWTEVKVVFIPKAGKKSAQLPKSYRPISLSSFFLKTMEKIIDQHIRDENLKQHPLYRYQFAYQAGKSTETAIHCLTTTIEKALAAQQIVLGAFIDISGAFDNTSYEAIHKALINKGVSPMIINWILGMLKSRIITVDLEKEACLGALRLQGVANLKSGDLTGHLKILEIFFSSPIVHLSDVQLPRMEPKSGTQMAPNLKMETQELGYGGHASVGQ
ncbi:hypothetical protein ACLKA6_020046 [Drosophila palustris]